MGFRLLESLLPSLVVEEVCVVFSPVIVDLLVSNCRHEGKNLYSAAKHLVSILPHTHIVKHLVSILPHTDVLSSTW